MTKYQRVSLSIFLYFSQVIQTAPVLLPFAFLWRVIKVSRYHFLIFSNFGKRPKIDSLDKWLTAFGIYASVVVAKFPHKASQLFAYQRIIREAAQKFKGLVWYAYDVEFRKLAAKNPALNWGERHLQLYLDKFTGLARSVCFVCGSADHLSDLCPLSSPRPDSKRTSFPANEGYAEISTGESHAQPNRVPSNTAAISPTVVDGMAPTNMQTTALNELMTLRVAESTSKVFVDSLKPLTPINVNLLASLLTDHPDRVFADGLCSDLRDGFKIG